MGFIREACLRAVLLHAHGGPEALQLEDIPPPETGPGDVRVDLAAAGLNRLDLWLREGSPGLKLPFPHILGCDGAGIVADVGEGVRTFKTGDRVLISPGMSCGVCRECLGGRDNLCREYSVLGARHHGTYREAITLPERNLLPIPSNMSFSEAAAASLVFLTAWHMLVGRARLRPGETVLVHAGGSGVGSAAIQIAKLFHCRVLTTAGTEAKLEKARALGADGGILYHEQDFAAETMRLTAKAGVDVVIEHIGGEVFEKSLTCIRKGGRLVTCGNTVGPKATISTAHLFGKHLDVLGSFMGEKQELIDVLKFLASGQLKAVVDREFPLEQVADAHRHLAGRDIFGKVVLRMDLS